MIGTILPGQNGPERNRNKGILYTTITGGACGVMVIVIGNGHSDTSSNPGRDQLYFTLH